MHKTSNIHEAIILRSKLLDAYMSISRKYTFFYAFHIILS